MKMGHCSRRSFLRHTATLAAGAPLAIPLGRASPAAAEAGAKAVTGGGWNSNGAIVGCRSYGPEVRAALAKAFDLLGGIGPLVKDKTVTVKINLTGTDFRPFLDRPVGETFMTHYSTALALGGLLFDAGARRVRFVESTQSRSELAATLAMADWDVKELQSLGKVEFENTRNLGLGKSYSHLRVPTGGYVFSEFDFNHSYGETDVMVSLAKLKNHITAGGYLMKKKLLGRRPNTPLCDPERDMGA